MRNPRRPFKKESAFLLQPMMATVGIHTTSTTRKPGIRTEDVGKSWMQIVEGDVPVRELSTDDS